MPTDTTPRNNRLPHLAATIQAAHADIQKGAIAIAERALEAGAALIEAKAALPHGAWAGWLKAHTGLSARTAQRYMQISKSGLKTATVADLGIKAASAALAKRKDFYELVQERKRGTFLEIAGEDFNQGYLTAILQDWLPSDRDVVAHLERNFTACATSEEQSRFWNLLDVQNVAACLEILDLIRRDDLFPAVGCYAYSEIDTDHRAWIWRPIHKEELFHVNVWGKTSNEDRPLSVISTDKPVSRDGIMLTLINAGFDVFHQQFTSYKITDGLADFLNQQRDFTVGQAAFAEAAQ